MHYSSGNTYTGQWEADRKQGQGCMQWAQGEQYTGRWFQGLQNGIGCHVWAQPASLVNGTPNHAFFLMHNRFVDMTVAVVGTVRPWDAILRLNLCSYSRMQAALSNRASINKSS